MIGGPGVPDRRVPTGIVAAGHLFQPWAMEDAPQASTKRPLESPDASKSSKAVKAATEPADDERFALVIGNQEYSSICRLSNPVADARAVAERLQTLRFDVALPEDATRANIDAAFEALQDKVVEVVEVRKKQTVVLLFFAGHGLHVHGTNYALGKETDNYTLRDRSGVRACGVALETMLGDLQLYLQQDNRRNMCICILDCCREIPEWAPDRMRTAGSGGLREMMSRGGTMILHACAAGKTAKDRSGPNSPFTTELLDKMTLGANPAEVCSRVSLALDESTGGKQVPWQSINHYPEDWAF